MSSFRVLTFPAFFGIMAQGDNHESGNQTAHCAAASGLPPAPVPGDPRRGPVSGTGSQIHRQLSCPAGRHGSHRLHDQQLRQKRADCQRSYPLQRAYDYFVREFESLLLFTFELTDTADMFPETSSDGKRLLYTCIIAAVQKVYLEKYLEALTEENH